MIYTYLLYDFERHNYGFNVIGDGEGEFSNITKFNAFRSLYSTPIHALQCPMLRQPILTTFQLKA